MGLFSSKPSLSEEEIDERLTAIADLYDQERYEELFREATELDKEAPGHGAFFLGFLYSMGEAVEEDAQKAMMYFRNGTNVNNYYTQQCWLLGGIQLFSDDAYAEAIRWLERAREFGDDEDETALPTIAACEAKLAFQYRERACNTLRMDELTQTNAVVVEYAVHAQDLFMECAKRFPESMEVYNWVMFGQCAELLYNMTCRGELSMNMTDSNSLSTWLGNSFRMAGGANDQKFHDEMLQNVAVVCDAMDVGGRPLIGEYFRAICGLLDSELHHSAEAFYRVRWHMKRIGELREIDEDAEEIARLCGEVNILFKKMQKKYDRLVVDMMRRKQMPDLTPSYLPGKAPAPQSCAKFMAMLNDAASGTATASPFGGQEKKGLFSFFRR